MGFLAIAREALVDLRSRAHEAKPRSGKRESRTGEGGNYKAILLNFFSIKALFGKMGWWWAL